MKSFITLFLLFSQFSEAKTVDQIDVNLISMKGNAQAIEVKETCHRINKEVESKINRFIEVSGLTSADITGGTYLKVTADRPTRWSRNQFVHECRLKIAINNPDYSLKVSDSKIKHRGSEQMRTCLQERDSLNSRIDVLYSELFAGIFNCQNLKIVEVISQNKDLKNQ
jgi:hypothetical protein